METKCPSCGEVVPLGGSKCPKCGAPMPPAAPQPPVPDSGEATKCGNCGAELPAGVTRCAGCGYGGGSAPAGSKRASIAEQVIMTLLFVLVGIPAGLFGACAGFFAVGGGQSGAPMAMLSVGGLAIGGLLLWLWIRAIRRG